MSGDKVHLMDLRLRTSAAGNQYLSGWLGRAAVVGFRDRDADDEVWNIFVSTPAPRNGSTPAASAPRRNCTPAEQSTPSRSRRSSSRRATEVPPGVLDDDVSDL
ncbi:hypothetical protein [Novosphingobium mathurense]|uniref:Uncharacterized protein n=1 Tax=Novosphingobium mathurense TaxID=428990 RepID=A0A1U6GTP2_9SPHN|nr:hypothetical protein [Novosphingobium mathurense]SLJ86892.1 hypothetical protein SAMN06295987_101404 [Novosphingobium mathurense]